jgi:hypothetical protein
MAKEQLDFEASAAAIAKALAPPALPGAGTGERAGGHPASEQSSGDNFAGMDFDRAAPSGMAPPPLPGADQDDDATTTSRRVARRRPAGPSRTRVAANDDAPTIGGLIFALEQKPSNRPFHFAGIFSALWSLIGIGIGGLHISNELEKGSSLVAVLASPQTLFAVAAVALPVGVVWFLALLAWRAEELRLRSSTMTEVAVRLAEPDRMAEQSIASLGQSVRRQVSFMNDAVSRALGRAGELEALVHSEVSALERSYDENEKRIRGLIQELSGERHALLNTSDRVAITLRTLGSEVPGLIDKLADQQIKLSGIISAAGQNLTSLETALTQGAGQLETSLGARTVHLQSVLEGSASRIEVALSSHTEGLDRQLTQRSEQMQGVLENYTSALATVLSARTEEMQAAFDDSIRTLDSSLGNRTENLQTVFEEYARALDTTLANRAQALDIQLVERTTALDSAFSDRLQLFDDSIRRSTALIDSAVNERASALTTALDAHSKTFRETITRQSGEIDESIMQGINAVRRSSENITRQSLKAIEGLAGQSELLRNVSENLLGQINSVTNRFELQGQQILKAANALESANYKIDNTLQARHSDLSRTLDRISGSADDFGKVLTHYSSAIEGTVSEAEKKARMAAEELRVATEQRSRAAVSAIEQLSAQSASQSDRALEDLRRRFSSASGDVAQEIGQISSQLDNATNALRNRSQMAAAEIAQEQARLRAELDSIPLQARSSAETMRRSLQEQLAALDQLQELAGRSAHTRDIAPPFASAAPTRAAPPPPSAQPPGPPPGPTAQEARALSTLSSLLSRERNAPGANDQRWSFGDLLARASEDDGHPQQQQGQLEPAAPFTLNVGIIARALDPAAADAIWSRLRRGERGITARSIYTAEGRMAYDEINRRVKTDADLQGTITRFLADFERILRDAEAQDPSGRLIQDHLVSDNGRVYLFLAHASGRLV